jgi:hypothetical protein
MEVETLKSSEEKIMKKNCEHRIRGPHATSIVQELRGC